MRQSLDTSTKLGFTRLDLVSPVDLPQFLKNIEGGSYDDIFRRSRPYKGQPHTFDGERGKTEVKKLTFRDLKDCLIRAFYDSSGLPPHEYPKDVYQLPLEAMDPIAICQNLCVEVEKVMGIYPNIPE